MNWNPNSRANAAITGGALGLMISVLTVILYAAVTSAPPSLHLIVTATVLAITALLGLLFSRILRPVTVRHAMSVPVLMGLMAHGAAHAPALLLAATLLLTLTLRPARPALHLPLLTLTITTMLGLSVQLQGGVTLSALVTLCVPFAALLLARAKQATQDAAQHPNLHLSALLATVVTAALSAPNAPLYIVMTVTALIALHVPAALIERLRTANLLKRQRAPEHVDT